MGSLKAAIVMNSSGKRFQIALSFPGEHRPFVKQVAERLAAAIGQKRVLYDHYYTAEFARPDLDVYLQRLYHDESDLIAVFLCADYAQKEWCGLEWRAVRDLIKKRKTSDIMPFRFDNTAIDGLFSIDGYVWIDKRSPDEVAELILQRFQINSTAVAPAHALSPANSVSTPIIAPARLHHGADVLFGREKELKILDDAWADPGTHVVTFVAWGGVGKTSLIIEWMARRAKENWVGFDRVFDWSFYSQGTREEGGASADLFVAKALAWFGDEAMANSPASAWDKGARLAELVGKHRTLLVLDGLEPLQYPPGPLGGRLKDPAVETLLSALARNNRGLCVVTTREQVADLAPYNATTAPEYKLEHLSEEAGAHVLHKAGANRAGTAAIKRDDDELRAASREVAGHALTLRLLGGYLALTCEGDIRKRDVFKLNEADPHFKTNVKDADKPYGHAFKVMGAYERWLESGGEEGKRQLAVLRLLALFDRPADAGCLAALRKAPAIQGVTESLVDGDESQWNAALKRLSDCGLASLGPDGSVDAHPLIREYFAKQLRETNLKGWQAAQACVYHHLRDSTPDKPEPSLAELQPLYQAVVHGCQAGLQQKACDDVYHARIQRGDEHYAPNKLGAFGAELGAIACFFERPWDHMSPTLSEPDQAWLLGEAAFTLRAVGRLTEALEPIRAGLPINLRRNDWRNAAIKAGNLSELELTLGRVADAVADAERCVEFADRSGVAFERNSKRTVLADALHQAGRRDDALTLFVEAEAMEAARHPEHPLLYSMRGYLYCDLLISECERAAWRRALIGSSVITRAKSNDDALTSKCREIERRAKTILEWEERMPHAPILDLALHHLTLGRTAFLHGVLTHLIAVRTIALEKARRELDAAVDGLRGAGRQDDMPRGLLARAWLRFTDGNADGARADLDEAWRIAERGSMRLFMADVHLHRARLFLRATPYPWESVRSDLAAARKLIEECGYGRRKEELEDAERAAESP